MKPVYYSFQTLIRNLTSSVVSLPYIGARGVFLEPNGECLVDGVWPAACRFEQESYDFAYRLGEKQISVELVTDMPVRGKVAEKPADKKGKDKLEVEVAPVAPAVAEKAERLPSGLAAEDFAASVDEETGDVADMFKLDENDDTPPAASASVDPLDKPAKASGKKAPGKGK